MNSSDNVSCLFGVLTIIIYADIWLAIKYNERCLFCNHKCILVQHLIIKHPEIFYIHYWNECCIVIIFSTRFSNCTWNRCAIINRYTLIKKYMLLYLCQYLYSTAIWNHRTASIGSQSYCYPVSKYHTEVYILFWNNILIPSYCCT